MNRFTDGHRLDNLDGLERRAGRIFYALGSAQRHLDRTCREDTRSSALIWETDKVRIGEPVI